MKRAIFLFLLLIMSVGMVSAVNTYKIDSNISINHPVRIGGYPAPGALCNISVTNPTGDTVINYKLMTNGSSVHNYTVLDTLNDDVGLYDYFITCSLNGYNETGSFQYEVTYTGKEATGTGFIVVYSLIFILIFAFIIYFFLHGIAKGGKFQYDIKDLSVSWGFLFAFLAMYLIFIRYWADAVINDIFLWLLYIIITTNGLVPIVLFMVSIFFGSVKSNKPYEMFGGGRK